MRKSPTKPEHLANPKPVVADLRQRREHAAWKLLEAVRELFPQKFAELEELKEDVRCGVYDILDCEQEEKLDYQVWRWTERNGISCDAVKSAAYEFAKFANSDLDPVPTFDFSAIEGEFGLSPVSADPLRETLDEFQIRAKAHYLRKRKFLNQLGHPRIPKHEQDHFRYLAFHRVGGYTWQLITETWNQVPNTTKRDLKTVAGEARKIAKLLGLVPSKRGRRPGSRDKRRRKQVVRR